MVDYRLTVSDSKTKLAYQIAVTGPVANKLIGKNIGDVISGDVAGMAGYSLKITGGTDKDGFAMRGDLPGPSRRKVLVAGGVGYNPVADGAKRRKSMRGREISSDISQINTVIVEYGEKPMTELFAKKEGEEAKEEAEKPRQKAKK